MPTKDNFHAIGAAAQASSSSFSSQKQALAEQKAIEGIETEVKRIVIWGLRLGAALLFIVILVRAWHLIGPVSCHWLTAVDIQSIDKMLFSSAFGGMVLNYLRESLSKQR